MKLHLIGLLSTASGFMLGKGTPFVTSTVDPPCPPVLSTVNLPNPVPSDLEKAFNAIEALLQLTVDPKATPAVSAGVMYKGKLIWSYGYGTVNKTAPAQVPNPDTIFRIGSISKIFPVLTLYQLIEQGKVASIDDPVSKYCSDFSVQNPFPGTDSTTPTWRQIASQISGLPREAPCPPNDCDISSADMFDRIGQMNLIAPPFVRSSYSNLAFSILGRAQEYIVKEPFETLCQKQILDRLGMTNTGFNVTKVEHKMAVGYNADGSVADLVNIGWSAPAGQMYSSVRDLLNLTNTLSSFQDGFLTQASQGEIQAPVFFNGDGETLFGTPWEARFANGHLVRRKGGNINGYAGFVATVPELHLSTAVLWNGQVNEFAVADGVWGLLLPGFEQALQKLQPAAPLPPDPSQYTGTYTSTDPALTAVVAVTNGTMTITGPNIDVVMAYASPSLLSIIGPTGSLSCLDLALNAFLGEWVQFAGPGGSKTVANGMPFVAFQIPGLLPQVTFNRVSHEPVPLSTK